MKRDTAASRCCLLLVLMALFASGCIDFKAVRSFSSATDKVTTSLKSAFADIPESCNRRNEYLKWRGITPSSNACQKITDKVKGLNAIVSLLGEYAKALGRLADDQVAKYDKEIGGLGGAIAKASGLKASDEKVKAVTDIASYLATIVTNCYRSGQLKKVITNVHPKLDKVKVVFLRIINDYKTILNDEQVVLKATIAIIDKQKTKSFPLRRLRSDVEGRSKAVDAKFKSIEELKGMLGSMVSSHGKLMEYKFDAKELIASIKKYAKEIYPLVEKTKKAFSK